MLLASDYVNIMSWGCIVSTGLLFKNCKPNRKHYSLNIVSNTNGTGKLVRDAKAMAANIAAGLLSSAVTVRPAYA